MTAVITPEDGRGALPHDIPLAVAYGELFKSSDSPHISSVQMMAAGQERTAPCCARSAVIQWALPSYRPCYHTM